MIFLSNKINNINLIIHNNNLYNNKIDNNNCKFLNITIKNIKINKHYKIFFHKIFSKHYCILQNNKCSTHNNKILNNKKKLKIKNINEFI